MINCPYCNKLFSLSKNVRGHVPSCSKNTREYYIDLQYGPIHYKDVTNLTSKQFKDKYPNTKFSLIKDSFKNKNIVLNSLNCIWNRNSIINSIQKWYAINNKIPSHREFSHSIDYPHHSTVQKYFGSWNEAIIAAGFIPEFNDGFGNRTIAKDGVLYRSQNEAYFVDNHLFGKYDYIYEPKYDNSRKLYDFYIPSLDLYIEIDGGLRPETIRTKIIINKQENKNLLIIDNVYNFAGIAQR